MEGMIKLRRNADAGDEKVFSHKSTGKRKQIEEDDAEVQLLDRDSEEVCSLPASTLTSLRLI